MQFVEEKIKFVDGKTSVKRYEIQCRIGEGAFSTCYKVKVANSDSLFAMKLIPKNKIQVLKRVKLFEQIKIHQSLLHPNIVFLDHWFEDQENQYKTGLNKTLENKCKKQTSTSEADIARYGLEIMRALKYLHSMKIVHRDLKLSNFFIGFDGSIKLGDFGFACKIQDGQMKRDSCGTPNYTAPQVIRADGYRFLPDIWSFGCVLYRMKYGVCPFESEDLQQILRKVRLCQWKFKDWVNISPQLADLLKRILVHNPADRISLEQMEKHAFFNPKQGISRSLKNFVSNLFGRRDQSSTKSIEGQTSTKSIEGKNNIKAILKEKVQVAETAKKTKQPDYDLEETCKSNRNNRQRSLSSKKTDIINFLQGKETKKPEDMTPDKHKTICASDLLNKVKMKNIEAATTIKRQQATTITKRLQADSTIKTARQSSPKSRMNSYYRSDTEVSATTVSSNSLVMPLNPLAKLKNKFRTNIEVKKTLVNDVYVFFTVSKLQMSNEYLLVQLTNGVNQIFKGKEAYIFTQKGRFFDIQGKPIGNPPKIIDYLSNQKMTARKTSTISCQNIITNSQYVRRWKEFEGRILVHLTKAIAMTTPLSNMYYLAIFGQRDLLYNNQLEVYDELPDELLKCREIYKNYCADIEKRRERSTSRGKKILE